MNNCKQLSGSVTEIYICNIFVTHGYILNDVFHEYFRGTNHFYDLDR